MLPLIITIIILGIIYGVGSAHASHQRAEIKRYTISIFEELKKHVEPSQVKIISKGTIGTCPSPYISCLDGTYKSRSISCLIEKIPGNLLSIALLEVNLRSHQTVANPPKKISPLKALFPKKQRITPAVTLQEMPGVKWLSYRKKITLNELSNGQNYTKEILKILDELINIARKIGFEF
jgi:hypothetical protein